MARTGQACGSPDDNTGTGRMGRPYRAHAACSLVDSAAEQTRRLFQEAGSRAPPRANGVVVWVVSILGQAGRQAGRLIVAREPYTPTARHTAASRRHQSTSPEPCRDTTRNVQSTPSDTVARPLLSAHHSLSAPMSIAQAAHTVFLAT